MLLLWQMACGEHTHTHTTQCTFTYDGIKQYIHMSRSSLLHYKIANTFAKTTLTDTTSGNIIQYKLCSCRWIVRCAGSVKILPTAAQLQEQVAQQLQNKSEVMKLETQSTICNNLCASSSDMSTVVRVIHKLDQQRVLLITQIDLPCRNSLSQSFGQSSRGKYPYFWRYPNFLIDKCRIGRRKLHGENELDLFLCFHRTPICDRRTDTDRQTNIGPTMAYTALA